MKNILWISVILILISCGRKEAVPEKRIITVSIAPFKYFIEAIAGDEYDVNIMVPAGSNPHIYEPYPGQISKLKKSIGYVSNGFLGFEITWLDRFYEMNRKMKKLSLCDAIEPIKPDHEHSSDHIEGADPHYWVSPACAYRIAASVRDFLEELNPEGKNLYAKRYNDLIAKIKTVDDAVKQLAIYGKNKKFMIYHPNLAYLARDYGLEEIPVEFEGKEPSPSRMRFLIDIAKKENLRVIMVQKEYDTKNARAIASETGAKVVVIDPLSEDWYSSVSEIINILKENFELQMK